MANRDLWEPLVDLYRSRPITFRWVKGHGGNEWNDLADRLAVQASADPGRRRGRGSTPSGLWTGSRPQSPGRDGPEVLSPRAVFAEGTSSDSRGLPWMGLGGADPEIRSGPPERTILHTAWIWIGVLGCGAGVGGRPRTGHTPAIRMSIAKLLTPAAGGRPIRLGRPELEHKGSMKRSAVPGINPGMAEHAPSQGQVVAGVRARCGAPVSAIFALCRVVSRSFLRAGRCYTGLFSGVSAWRRPSPGGTSSSRRLEWTRGCR